MDYQTFAQRNETLLAEDDKEAEHKSRAVIINQEEKRAAEHKAPVVKLKQSRTVQSRQEVTIPSESCSTCLGEYMLPLSCFLFLGLCIAGGAYCHEGQRCLYSGNSDSSTNGTATDSGMLQAPHSNILMRQQNDIAIVAHGYKTAHKYMLHPIKNRRWNLTKKR